MEFRKAFSQDKYNHYFVELFLRKAKSIAKVMYRRMGCVVYRTLIMYYDREEDAYDMRKPLKYL